MLNQYFYILLIVGITLLSLATFVLLKGPRKKINQAYSLYAASSAIWAIFEAFGITAQDSSLALLLWRISHMGVIFIPVGFVHFVYCIVDIENKMKKIIFISYVTAFIFMVLNCTKLFILKVAPKFSFRWFINPGAFYYLFLPIWIYWVSYGLFELFKWNSKSTGAKKNQLKYYCWSTLLAYVGGIPNFFPTFNIEIPILMPFGTYSIIIYSAFTVYAILKHRLIDVKVALTRTGIFIAVYTLVLGLPFAIAIWWKRQLLDFFGASWWTAPLILMALLATVGPFLYIFLQRRAENRLLREQKRYQKILKQASLGMTHLRDLRKLLDFITYILTKTVKISFAAIYLYDRQSDEYLLHAVRDKAEIAFPKLALDNPLVDWINKKHSPIIYEEIKRQAEESKKLESLTQQLEKLNTSLCIPCFFEDKLIGFFLLGEKLSGDIYTQEDIDIFMTLANHAASAIENCWAYEELKEKEKLLVEAEKLAAVGRLASNIAHEIKNPLAPIKTYTEFLDEKIDDPKFRQDFKKVILEETNRINHIVEQLINYGHPKKLNKSEVDIRQIIENTLHLLENDLKKENISVRQDYASTSQAILADPQQLKQVFLNILLNSIQALEKVTDRPKEIKIATYLSDDTFTIRIQDTGCGIKKEELPFIFDPFFSTKDRGSGLGLSIVQSIIKNHGGVILAESQLNQGTTFSINLPK